MRKYLLVIIILYLQISANAYYSKCNLEQGDLVFFVEGESPHDSNFSNAVKQSHSQGNVFHVGIIYQTFGNDIQVVHASPEKGVVRESLENIKKSLNSHKNLELHFFKVLATKKIKHLAAQTAHAFIGQPYNDLFSNNRINSKGEFSFYCSQLIEVSYNKSSRFPIFPQHTLNFKNKRGQMIEYWHNYYAQRNAKVPFNEKGSHPGSLYKSDRVGRVYCSK